MTVRDVITVALTLAGAAFFLAGTIGILRFPDARSRLHAVSKADGVGLALIVLGLVAQATPAAALKLVGIWLLVVVGSASATLLIAGLTGEGADG